MMSLEPIVFIVDDEPAIRSALTRVLKQAGLNTKTFSDAESFLRDFEYQGPCCLVLDVRMPGMDGITLQQNLLAQGICIPIIFLTGSGTIPMAVSALHAGAFDFLEKPFDNDQLIACVCASLEQDAQRRYAQQERVAHEQKLSRLTRREREVMELLMAGKSNKAIAQVLNISQRTVETHRENLLAKLEIRSLLELVPLQRPDSSEPL